MLIGALQEIKEKMREIKGQTKDVEKEIENKQKMKEEIGLKLTKRDSMVAYQRKQIKTCTEAIGKFEVCFQRIKCMKPDLLTFIFFRYQQELAKIREKLARLEATAEKTGPRIEVTHNEDELAKLIKRNENKLT